MIYPHIKSAWRAPLLSAEVLSVMLAFMQQSLLKINNFGLKFTASPDAPNLIDGVSFAVEAGQTVALVGESGSGKSVTALSVLQLLGAGAHIDPQASITLRGEELLNKGDSFMQTIRGSEIGIIFQEPLTALNPLHTIQKQIAEPLVLHGKLSNKGIDARVLELLDLVGLGALKERLNAYPHELSGGQRQRVMIAMALANEPKLLIADEPTTALDVTVQAQILDLLQDLKDKLNMGLLLITHDLPVVRKMADYVCVMEQGKLVEQGLTKDIFNKPQHPYTKRLLNAQPSGQAVPANENAQTLLEAKNMYVRFPKAKGFFGQVREWVHAVNGIDLQVKVGQTLGIVGESGSGKSTLGMALLRLVKSKGTIVFAGQDIESLSKAQLKALRADMQIVFQDPFGSLSPRMSVGDIIAEGLKVHQPNMTAPQRDIMVQQALTLVQMDPETRHRYPHEFSGGQRQRISIARALILHPKLIILDEPTSALDVSVQAEIVDLLRSLQQEHDLSYIFISHDLRVVRALAHDVIVMKDGNVVEHGTVDAIFDAPQQAYTQNLLKAALY